jgi:hypothetical protein
MGGIHTVRLNSITSEFVHIICLVYRTTPTTNSGHPLVRLRKYTMLTEAGSKSMYWYNGDKFSLDTTQSHPLIGEGAPKIL